MKTKHTPRSAFTLIELLTVIAIIGILAKILIPAVGQVREVANKSKSSANMRSIAVSYATYSTAGGRIKTLTRARLDADTGVTFGNTVASVAQFLAKNAELTDASIWIIDADPLVTEYDGQLPAIVGFRNKSNAFETAPLWTADAPVGYDYALGVGGNDPISATPLLWTRGLTSGGTWPNDSPWGLGGHIAFLDGHISFYTELGSEDGQLVNPSNGSLTNSIEDVVGSANILRAPSPRGI
jgi:prepilin-type N-terminal cleavage/methylation domain-containing protein